MHMFQIGIALPSTSELAAIPYNVQKHSLARNAYTETHSAAPAELDHFAA